jgi:hypothetical protein
MIENRHAVRDQADLFECDRQIGQGCVHACPYPASRSPA